MLGYGNPNAIGDDETPATNPTNGGLIELPNHLSPIDYRAVTPARLLDTRSTGATIDDQFEAGGQRAAGSTLQLAVAGRGGTPADAASVTLSIAAVSPSAVGYITVWPCAEPQPLASSINYVAGQNIANELMAGLSPDGVLPEIVEYEDHPWFIGVQFHPELKSRPFEPHPLFASFIEAAAKQSRLV